MKFAYKSYEIPKSPLDGSTEIYRPEIVVLGQTGFLEHFDVRLFGAEHVVELKPNASFPKRLRRSKK